MYVLSVEKWTSPFLATCSGALCGASPRHCHDCILLPRPSFQGIVAPACLVSRPHQALPSQYPVTRHCLLLILFCFLHGTRHCPGPYVSNASAHHCASRARAHWDLLKHVLAETLWLLLASATCPRMGVLPIPSPGRHRLRQKNLSHVPPLAKSQWTLRAVETWSHSPSFGWGQQDCSQLRAIFRVCLCGNRSLIGYRERTAKLFITAFVLVLFPSITQAVIRHDSHWRRNLVQTDPVLALP